MHRPSPLCENTQPGQVAPPPIDMMTVLLSSVHDMKNSICVMSAYLESAVDASRAHAADSPESQLTRQALYEAQRLNYHLFQILALYKLNEGMYPFDPSEVELHAFAEETLARIQRLADAKGITLKLHIDPVERYWYFDHELILSLVTQTLFNALRYTEDQVRLSLHVVDEQLEICIEDNGAGYPAFMLDQSQPHHLGINSQTGSTGLGLYFASQVARMHRHRGEAGFIRLENGGELGGSRFILTLP